MKRKDNVKIIERNPEKKCEHMSRRRGKGRKDEGDGMEGKRNKI